MRYPVDYMDEMERLSSQEADEILSGADPTTPLGANAAGTVQRLRNELLSQPPAATRQLHLAAMLAAARSGEPGVSLVRSRPRKRAATLALAAALVLGAGIAGALTLPDQASEVARERVADLQPPGRGQADEGQEQLPDDSSAHGKTVSGVAHDDAVEGCEHGRAVSGAASSEASGHRSNQGDHPGACGPSEKSNGNHGEGSNGNHGLGNNGNHGEGDNGNHGLENNGNHSEGDNGNHTGQSADTGEEVPGGGGGHGNSGQGNGPTTAPGQNKESSDSDELPDPLPTGA
jgi:hypothetical protein